MPKEFIGHFNPDEDNFVAAVQWTPDQYMQVGIQVTDPDKTLVDYLYADDRTLAKIGEALHRWLYRMEAAPIMAQDFRTSEEQQRAFIEAGQEIIKMVAASRTDYVERDGIWVTLSRHQANVFVRFIRKARNAVFGSDE